MNRFLLTKLIANLRAVILILILCYPQIVATCIAIDSESVMAFKKHLSNTPCYSRIIYSEESCNNVIMRTLYAGSCNGSFFLRQLTGRENIDFPISNTNRNASPLYVGRLGDTRWQIAGYDLSLSIQPDSSHPDPYAGMSDGMQTMLYGILNCGSQHVQLGSFEWSGDRFEAKPSKLARQFGVTNNWKGELLVREGFVTKMIIPGSGAWAYKYAKQAANLPVGIPNEIITLGANDSCVGKVVIHQMVAGQTVDEAGLFDPTRHLDPKLTVLHVLSNSVEIVKPKNNPLVTKINVEEMAPFARKERFRRAHLQVILIGCFFVVSLSFSIWVLLKRPRGK